MGYIEYLNHPAIMLTLKITFSALLLQIISGIPLGIYLSGNKNTFKKTIEVMVSLPMVFPPMALGFFLILVLGKNGFIGGHLWELFNLKIVFSFWGLLSAAYIVGLPYMVKSVQSAKKQMQPSLTEAAQTLGKSKLSIFFNVIIPNIRPGILSGLLLAIGRSMGEIGISLMLGGNITGRTETLSLAIYNAVFEGDFMKATALSIILSVIAIFILLVFDRLNRSTT